MRLFAALYPPAAAVEHLDDFLAPRREAGTDLRWTDTEQFHVTLAFMPEVAEHLVEPLADALAESLSERRPLDLRVIGGGAFPNAAEAKVIWGGLDVRDDPAGESLTSLARTVRLTASHAGAAPQGGPFRAHLTVARSRRAFEATRWLRILEAYAGPAWIADEVTLVASHLGESRGRRPRYEVMAQVALGG
jgi:2'-5' RNA ligase